MLVVDPIDVVVVVEAIEELVDDTVDCGATELSVLDPAPLHALMAAISNTTMSAIHRLATIASPSAPTGQSASAH